MQFSKPSFRKHLDLKRKLCNKLSGNPINAFDDTIVKFDTKRVLEFKIRNLTGFFKIFFSARLKPLMIIFAKFHVCRPRGFGETKMSQSVTQTIVFGF